MCALVRPVSKCVRKASSAAGQRGPGRPATSWAGTAARAPGRAPHCLRCQGGEGARHTVPPQTRRDAELRSNEFATRMPTRRKPPDSVPLMIFSFQYRRTPVSIKSHCRCFLFKNTYTHLGIDGNSRKSYFLPVPDVFETVSVLRPSALVFCRARRRDLVGPCEAALRVSPRLTRRQRATPPESKAVDSKCNAGSCLSKVTPQPCVRAPSVTAFRKNKPHPLFQTL